MATFLLQKYHILNMSQVFVKWTTRSSCTFVTGNKDRNNARPVDNQLKFGHDGAIGPSLYFHCHESLAQFEFLKEKIEKALMKLAFGLFQLSAASHFRAGGLQVKIQRDKVNLLRCSTCSI